MDRNMNMDMGMQMDMDVNMDMNMDLGITESAFCMQMPSTSGTTMYMTGFQSTLMNPDAVCLNFFLANWTLDSKTKFILALIFVIALGVALEGIPVIRKKYLSRIKVKGNNYSPKGIKLVLSGLHGLQIFLGYILMLAAMTYSIELLLSAVFGLMLGYVIFEKEKDIGFSPSIQTQRTPCCGSLDYDNQSETGEDKKPLFEYIRLTSDNSTKSDYYSTSTDAPGLNESLV